MNSEYNKQHNRHPTEYCTSMKKSHNYMARINGLRRLNCTYRIETTPIRDNIMAIYVNNSIVFQLCASYMNA